MENFDNIVRQLKKLGKDLQNKKIGLALGGGAILGAAHIGVLKALEEFEISIDYISGTSIGAFIGTLYAFGKSPDEIDKIVVDLNWLDISKISFSQHGLLSNQGLAKLIHDEFGDINFKDANIPLAIVTTDIFNGEKVVLKEGNVSIAVMASTCIPGIFAPIDYQDKLLVDGGIVENVPVSPLREMNADYIIGVDLTTTHLKIMPDNMIAVLLNTFDIAFKYQSKIQMLDAEVLLALDLSQFNLFDRKQIPALIEKGYLDTKQLFQEAIEKT
ncbi:MAG TPA: patatin-like phospholipase family protein [Anaerolineales bacterium]|nr:patatin-like phospholipase family protein [Anaerolineales bacterium]